MSHAAPKEYADNVDKLQQFYINGMFTDVIGYNHNKIALQMFQEEYLNTDFQRADIVRGAYNNAESMAFQFLEVANQKAEVQH
ncbi:hypothetical protein [Agarivorans sp.]|uniref:hypothetical protein n=1 Tax=Agarivorans sp. TaxID=1872412 RepID=UPI003D0277B4